jgi:hypothetical protein
VKAVVTHGGRIHRRTNGRPFHAIPKFKTNWFGRFARIWELLFGGEKFDALNHPGMNHGAANHG